MKPKGDRPARPAWYEPHTGMRSDAYMLLAALLIDTPSEILMDVVRHLEWQDDIPEKLQETLAAISRIGTLSPVETIADEYRRLFVGLGSGELTPYGSWYLEKTIQSAPLAAIRSDLNRLGIVRQSGTFESEDHAGALCEVMALLSSPANEVPDSWQAAFFERHIAPWMPDFFSDLQQVEDAAFYRTVGEFGLRFLEEESKYLQNTQTG